jgi:hypothetical protein
MKSSTFLASGILAISSLANAINVTYDTGAWDYVASHSEVRVEWETEQTMVCSPFDSSTSVLCPSLTPEAHLANDVLLIYRISLFTSSNKNKTPPNGL